jgi:hypothetical protein
VVYHLDRDTVKAPDKAALTARLWPVDLSWVTVIAMDEFALRKGYWYAWVILEPYRKQVLWVSRGRAREDVRPFFAQLEPEGCQRLEAVVMDMSPVYAGSSTGCRWMRMSTRGRSARLGIRAAGAPGSEDDQGRPLAALAQPRQCPGRGAGDAAEAAGSQPAPGHHICPRGRLQAPVGDTYGAARRFVEGWYCRPISSRTEPLKVFARRLKAKLHSIVADCYCPSISVSRRESTISRCSKTWPLATAMMSTSS